MVRWYDSSLWDLIICYSIEFGLDPFVVAGIVDYESNGDTWAVRWEPNFIYRKDTLRFSKLDKITQKTESHLQSFSFGLMQIMGCVSRERGFDDCLLKLCIPDTGLYYGCKHFQLMMKKYKNIDEAISAYNWGSLKKVDGQYANQKYVDGVLKSIKEIETFKRGEA